MYKDHSLARGGGRNMKKRHIEREHAAARSLLLLLFDTAAPSLSSIALMKGEKRECALLTQTLTLSLSFSMRERRRDRERKILSLFQN